MSAVSASATKPAAPRPEASVAASASRVFVSVERMVWADVARAAWVVASVSVTVQVSPVLIEPERRTLRVVCGARRWPARRPRA